MRSSKPKRNRTNDKISDSKMIGTVQDVWNIRNELPTVLAVASFLPEAIHMKFD